MDSEIAYCSSCGHRVRLVFTDPPPHDGHANLRDGAQLVCLDFREECGVGACPATGRSGIVMGVRLARSHMNDEAFKTVVGRCDGCGEVVDLEILSRELAVCPLCDTTNHWVVLDLPDQSRISLTGR